MYDITKIQDSTVTELSWTLFCARCQDRPCHSLLLVAHGRGEEAASLLTCRRFSLSYWGLHLSFFGRRGSDLIYQRPTGVTSQLPWLHWPHGQHWASRLPDEEASLEMPHPQNWPDVPSMCVLEDAHSLFFFFPPTFKHVLHFHTLHKLHRLDREKLNIQERGRGVS